MNYHGKHYRTIWPDPENKRQIRIIDQRSLPRDFVIETITSADQMIEAIRDMHVRGAGLIGAAAGFGMYLAAVQGPNASMDSHLAATAQKLGASRPTARNLMWAVERMLQATNSTNDPEKKKSGSLHHRLRHRR